MLKKVVSYDEALDGIEAIDKKIIELLDHDDRYGDIMLLMQRRLVYISEITRLKDITEASDSVRKKAQMVFDLGNRMQEKVKDKRDKIKIRLDKNKRLEIKNKKLNY